MAVERFLNEQAWNRLMDLIDQLGAVDLDELQQQMDTIETTVNAAVATANAASQQAQNAANTATAMGNRVTDLETLTTNQGQSIRNLQTVSDDHTVDITALQSKTATYENNYTLNGITFKFRRFGKVVVVTSSGAPTVPIATGQYTDPIQLGDYYKPPADIIINTTVTTSNALQFFVNSAGQLRLGYPTEAISTNIRLNVAYYV